VPPLVSAKAKTVLMGHEKPEKQETVQLENDVFSMMYIFREILEGQE